ncbi:hypothetical protein GGI12_004442 [Dipsacomyces acuminosporus]|nr:hypothetical protein GGI12_004442 [Dipsacomyces acuminosporus]
MALVDTAEIQIGPHIFTDAKFYRITDSPANDQNTAADPPLLLFEFADNPGTLFELPKDLSIDHKRSSDDSLCMCFYAAPTQPSMREPCIIKQEWPDYNMAEKTCVRMDISVTGANGELTSMLKTYSEASRTVIWHQYGEALWNKRPSVKRWQLFFPRQQQTKIPPNYLMRKRHMSPDNEAESPNAVGKSSPSSSAASTPAPKQPRKQQQKQQQAQHKEAQKDEAEQDSTKSKEETEDVKSPLAFNLKDTSSDSDSDSDSGNDSDSDDGPRVVIVRSASHNLCKTPAKRPIKRSASSTNPTKHKARKISNSSPTASSRKCQYCGCNDTPMWRRGPDGTGTLCNACGVKWKNGKILQE